MPTKWTGQLSDAQKRILEACDGRGILGRHCRQGILPVWRSEQRTVKALINRGLVRETKVPKYAFNGITLTKEGAETLEPPASVTHSE